VQPKKKAGGGKLREGKKNYGDVQKQKWWNLARKEAKQKPRERQQLVPFHPKPQEGGEKRGSVQQQQKEGATKGLEGSAKPGKKGIVVIITKWPKSVSTEGPSEQTGGRGSKVMCMAVEGVR